MSIEIHRLDNEEMYQVGFSSREKHGVELLDYYKFLIENNIEETLLKHDLAPSDTWRLWSSKTYTGFSICGNFLVQSGHNFSLSKRVGVSGSSLIKKKIKKLFGLYEEKYTNDEQKHFKKIYPNYTIPVQHTRLETINNRVYYSTAEAVILSGQEKVDYMLEVGPGAGIHVAFRHLLNPSIKSVLIDLPDTIPILYLTLRSVLPDSVSITLPHQYPAEGNIRIILPNQDPGSGFDFAFNKMSFQEMKIDTVNKYLVLFYDRLRKGGKIQSVNLDTSRQYPSTSFQNYRFKTKVDVKQTPFHKEVIPEFTHLSATAVV